MTTLRGMTLIVPATWVVPLDAWGAYMRAADRPETTRYLRDYQMRRFAADHRGDPWVVSTDDLIGWLGAKVEWASETKRAYRAALRSFYTWAHITGRISANPSWLLPTIKAPIRKARPAPEAILSAALTAADPRVRLMVLLAARQGLRRGEIAQIHTRDLVEDLLGTSLRVHGKGAKERVIPLCEEVGALLEATTGGFVFPGQINGHLSPARVGKLVSTILGPGWTTHTLRHRFATRCYAGERDLFALQELLGHSRPETTRQYVLIPTDDLRRSIAWAA
jgi:integrase/recombinase XerC